MALMLTPNSAAAACCHSTQLGSLPVTLQATGQQRRAAHSAAVAALAVPCRRQLPLLRQRRVLNRQSAAKSVSSQSGGIEERIDGHQASGAGRASEAAASTGGTLHMSLSESEGSTAAAAASMAAAEAEEAAADAAGAAAATEAGSDGSSGGTNSSIDGASSSSSGGSGSSFLQSKEVAEMLAFAVPALGMVLADPMMSLIDTACLGRVSSLQLAALAPNTAIFNFAFQLFAFLGVGTTNVIASNSLTAAGLDSSTRASRREAAERTLCNSLLLALVCGLLVTTTLVTCGRSFLGGMGTAAELMHPAAQYLTIRALAAPAVLLTSVSQGACLGQQDAWTPFKVVLTAAALSAAGDVYLIYQRGMGVVGAAGATVAAQYLGAAYFLWYLRRKGRKPGGIRLRWTGLPRLSQMQEFLALGVTLFSRTVFGLSAYFSMTTAATQLGTLSTATHQIAMQTFWFLSFFPEPLSLAAQSLLARDKGHPQRAAHLSWTLLKSGTVLGLILAGAVGAVFCNASWVFTTDVAVQLAVGQLAPVAMLAIAVCSVMMMLDGISVGSGSFAHLPPSNVAGLAATLGMLEVGKRSGWGLGSVWFALVAFYATRLTGHILHFWGQGGGIFAGGRSGSSSSDGGSAVRSKSA